MSIEIHCIPNFIILCTGPSSLVLLASFHERERIVRLLWAYFFVVGRNVGRLILHVSSTHNRGVARLLRQGFLKKNRWCGSAPKLLGTRPLLIPTLLIGAHLLVIPILLIIHSLKKKYFFYMSKLVLLNKVVLESEKYWSRIDGE